MELRRIPPRGVEQAAKTAGKKPVCESGGAESGAESAENTSISPDLQKLIDAWPNLPKAVKAGIVAMVNAAKEATDRE